MLSCKIDSVELIWVLFLFFCMHIRVALPVSGISFDKIGNLLAECPQIHVTVKINYYSIIIVAGYITLV